MKRIIALILAILMLATLLVSCSEATDNSENGDTEDDKTSDVVSLEAGFAREIITPEGSHPLQGYPQIRPSDGVHDDLMLTCTALRDAAGKTVLLYSIDSESVYVSRTVPWREAIVKAIPEVKYNDIVINATHTHYSPNATNNQTFVDIISEKLIVSAKAAIADLTPAEMYYGTNTVKNLNWIRRYYTDENGVYKHQFEADTSMPIIKITRSGNKKDIVLVNWAAHADSLSQNLMSADYVHYIRKTVEEGSDVLFSIHMGASGNVNPFSQIAEENYVHNTEEYGTELGRLINKFLSKKKNFTKADMSRGIASKTKTIPLVVDRSLHHLFNDAIELETANSTGDSERVSKLLGEMGGMDLHSALAIARRGRLPDIETMTVSTISVGDVAFAVAPYEMFAETGMNIKKASPFAHTFICATSNGFYSYIPTEKAFDFESYEVNITYYEKGSAEKIEAAIIELLEKIHK